MGQLGGETLVGKSYTQPQRQYGGKHFWRDLHNGIPSWFGRRT
jgi:hypothetical protein